MSLPPEDITDQELFLKLLERPCPAEIIDWPSKDLKIKVRVEVQRQNEIDDARLRAQKWVDKEAGKAQVSQGLLTSEVVADRVACELLSRAIKRDTPIPGTEERDAPRYPYIFADADAVRKALLPDELSILWNAYQLTQYRYGPYEDSVQSVEERNAWVAKLAKGGDAGPLLRLPLPHLLRATATLAAERYVLCAVLSGLLPTLPECWASALRNLGTGIGSSTYPPVKCTDQGGLEIDWEGFELEEPETQPKDYIDVLEIAKDIVRDNRLAALEPE